MATLLSALETQARRHLIETTASFWSSDELIAILNLGIKDLWGAIVDLHQDHFVTIDESNVYLAANSSTLTGVPTGVFRVLLLEPRDTTSSGATPFVKFTPRPLQSDAFRNARQLSAQDPTNGLEIFYSVNQAGAPVAAPTITVAPQVSSQVLTRFIYIPVQADLTSSGTNPIPGESDQALIAWCVAYARAKEREDRMPDPGWIQVYGTEKGNILTRLTPRQEQEPTVVEGVFDGWQ